MANENNKTILNDVYDMIAVVSRINDECRDRAFNSKREDLWRAYEVGHAAQVALAAYVVAIQSLEDTD